MVTMRKKKMDSAISLQDWNGGEYKLAWMLRRLFDVLAAGNSLRTMQGFPDLSSIAGRSKVKAGLGAHLLLRRVGRIRIHFARNGFARFRCLSGVEFFIRSATAKAHDSAGEKSETQPLHCR